MQTKTPRSSANLTALRDNITKAYRMDENECLKPLLEAATLPAGERAHISDIAKQLVIETRDYKKSQGKIDTLLQQYDLSTEEGISLMCLAEALLRIPDKATMDKFISDKLSTADWTKHLDKDNSLFINAATWSLLLTGKVYSPTLNHSKSMMSSLSRTVSKLGIAIIRPVILQMMKTIGTQFVMGQTIDEALKRAQKTEAMGYRYSYDMLGEAARTAADAKAYYDAYATAIDAIGKAATGKHPKDNPGISIKLTAFFPRYEYNKHDLVMQKLPPLMLALAQQAKKYNIGLTMDAEEADRLDISLDIYEKVFCDPSLDGWEGLGLAVQAYQKRAPYVLDWLINLSERQGKRMMVRLVKGAYWDAEIKLSQVMGYTGYPVFTRKNSTDVSYLACARKMLARPDCLFSQFGTHNAYSIAAIMEMAGSNKDFEFQCLHGMGRPIYDQIVNKDGFNLPCRIYAPVGTHRELLGYLVRRLLENGANTSFVNQLADESTPVDKIVVDPVARIASFENKAHPKIPLPKDIYGDRNNSIGLDLSDHAIYQAAMQRMQRAEKETWHAASIINGKVLESDPIAVTSPSDHTRTIGYKSRATEDDMEIALQTATKAKETWGNTPVEERTAALERAADLFQENMPELMALLSVEAGKSLFDGIAEVREAIDFCRYYSLRAREDFKPIDLRGPTGESNVYSLHPRGVMGCISPWNFPMAIFCGQVVAALATGNAVLAKPAEQTPLIAFKVVQLLHEAGVPKDALQLLIGQGSVVGAKIVSDPRVAGIIFTGSTATAKNIEQSLANRSGPIGVLIAETGGQNAMIVDSSALTEQAVLDIATSAFYSAGQRCSALRVLFVQEEMAPQLIEMLTGYMKTLAIGNPALLETDIGPVIDPAAQKMLQAHFDKMTTQGKLLAQVPLPEHLNGSFFAPCAFEIDSIDMLEGEVFGPILHVVRYPANGIDQVMEGIIKTGFGLTFGIQSRIDTTVQYVTNRMPIGNQYVNRNMIGAVVGVQPFGGEGLSGTGPKAGGPHYLPRLCTERTISTNTTAVGGNARLVSLLEEDS